MRDRLRLFLLSVLLVLITAVGFSSDLDDLAAAYGSFAEGLRTLHAELTAAKGANSPEDTSAALNSFCDVQEPVLNAIRSLSSGKTLADVPQNVKDAVADAVSAVQLTEEFPALVGFCIGNPEVAGALRRFYAVLEGE